jgi:hypothetical protein
MNCLHPLFVDGQHGGSNCSSCLPDMGEWK